MSELLLEVEELRVDYAAVTAVRDVSFALGAGEVYGLIGRNGAGKTTILRAIAGLVEPTHGDVRIRGASVFDEPARALQRLAFLPDFPPVHADLSVSEFLEVFACAYGIPVAGRRACVERALAEVALQPERDAPAGSLGRGTKQRLLLAKALLHDPDVLVLDEPVAGLDPEARAALGDSIRALGASGKAVLVSSHILSELQGFCTAVGMVEDGRLALSGRVAEVLSGLAPRRAMRLVLVERDERLGAFLAASPQVSEPRIDGATASFALAGDASAASALLRRLIEAGFDVAGFTAHERGLADALRDASARRAS